jgi:uncharacterized protein
MEKTASIWHFFIPRLLWKNVFLTPLYWLFLCFFQPVRFSEQFEYRTIAGRFTLIVRLALPLFLLIFLVALPVQGLLLCTASCTLLSIFTWNTLSTIFLATLFGVTLGLLIGVLDNVGLGIILSITLGITGIVMGDADRGAARGIATAIVIGLVTGTMKGVKWGIWRGILAGVLGGLAWTIASIPVTGVVDITRGTIVASIFLACYMIGYYRVPLYLVSGLSGLRAYMASRRNSTAVFLNLHNSSLYWDECVFFPLPLLRQTLLIAVGQNVEQALHEIAFIVKQRPQQIYAAQMTAIEVALRDLQSRETIRDIATASQHLNELLPQEVMLKESGSRTPFTHLIAVSLEAERYIGPFNWQTKRQALEAMRLTLDKIYPDTAFSNGQLNTLLADVITKWRNAIRYQQEKLEQGGGGVGQIINPYNPGIPLKPQDTLFVGRRDVVRQLSESLSKPNRPTFLLNGERRMGKSSTLRQLPHLLGASYIPVLYDLQVRSTSSSIEALLTKIAEEIYKTVSLRGVHIKRLKYSILHDALQKKEAAIYQPFDEWLDTVERVLQSEKITLLLLFDEFEKLEEARKAGYLDLNLLLDWSRNTIQNRSHIALLFSGVNTFGEMDENWASYFVNAKTFRVSFLKPAEARDLVTKPVPNFPATQLFSSDIVEEIIHVTGCHPFLVQAVCSEVIDNLNHENRERVEMPDVTNAVRNVLENWGDTYFRDLWLRTDQQQRMCLTLLSQEGASDVSALATASGLDEQCIRQTLQVLLKRDLVLEEQKSYRIAAPILDQWIARNF